MTPDAALPCTSKDIYTALSEQSATVEIFLGTDAGPLHFSTHRSDLPLQRLALGPIDSKTVNIDTPGASTSAGTSRLVVTSTLSNLSSRSCIRTIELSLDTTTPLTSPLHNLPSPTLPGRGISLRSLRASFKCALTGKAMLANGYQSWSTSFAGADESSVFEKPNWLYDEITQLGLASDKHIFAYPGEKGKVHSNLVTVIRDKCPDPSRDVASTHGAGDGAGLEDESARRPRPEELVLCGSLSEDSGYTYFLMDVSRGQLTILQDCAGKRLRTNRDKLVLRTFFAWDDRDTAVWNAYAAQWTSLYSDRRHIQSSLHHQLSGWTSWYCHYENINEHIILENLGHFTGSGKDVQSDREHFSCQWPAKVFQIDDGYTTVGDWLDWNKDKFPRGMAFIASAIQERGLIPGLWLAPFLVSKSSRIVQEHPDWLVRKHYDKEDDDGHPQSLGTKTKISRLGCCNFGFQDSSEFMLAHPAFTVGAYALDLENPEVQAHLANVFRIVVQEWGFKMLKLDFLFAAAQRPRNNKTRAQLMWEAMQIVRTWAGPETILLGCGVPLSASFMVVDYCRIGCDVGAGWDTMQRFFHDREYISCFNSLTSTLARWALSGRFFGNDPDVFFLRDWNMGLTLTERRTLMLLNHLLGHLVFCSDPFDLERMSAEQKEMLGLFFPWSSTPEVPAPAFTIERVLQPLPRVKELYVIHVQTNAAQHGDHKQGKGDTYIVLTNLSGRRQSTNLRVMDAIVASQNDAADLGGDGESANHAASPSVYFNATTGHFGSAAAAYTLGSRETCVFLRILDSAGRLCGLCTHIAPGRALAKKDTKAALDPIVTGQPLDSHQQLTVHLIATMGGSILPTMEIESFHYEIRKLQFTVKFRPCIFRKEVTVWLAWKTVEQEAVQADMLLSVNGHALKHCPGLLAGYGVSLASCCLNI